MDIRPSSRCGDTDRDRVIAALREAFAGGYLDAGEFSSRLEAAMTATEQRQLNGLLLDLTPVTRPRAELRAPPTAHDAADLVRAQVSRRPLHKRRATWVTTGVLGVLWSVFTAVSAANAAVPLHSLMARQTGALFFLAGILVFIEAIVTWVIIEPGSH